VADNYFFIIKARCNDCEIEHLLFDWYRHGWSGFVGQMYNRVKSPYPPLVPWKCVACTDTLHIATVIIASSGRDDFVEETAGGLDESLWPEAFGWFEMEIQCCQCGHTTKSWIGFETE
jgi:hypothetical protein